MRQRNVRGPAAGREFRSARLVHPVRVSRRPSEALSLPLLLRVLVPTQPRPVDVEPTDAVRRRIVRDRSFERLAREEDWFPAWLQGRALPLERRPLGRYRADVVTGLPLRFWRQAGTEVPSRKRADRALDGALDV
jgi:hypothetical protein